MLWEAPSANSTTSSAPVEVQPSVGVGGGAVVGGEGRGKDIVHRLSSLSLLPARKGREDAGEKKRTEVSVNTAQPSGRSKGATPSRL